MKTTFVGVLIFIIVFAIIWAITSYTGEFGEWAKYWLTKPITELQVWHLIIVIIIAKT